MTPGMGGGIRLASRGRLGWLPGVPPWRTARSGGAP